MLAPGFYNMDCMDGMREFPDGYFELAIVDPPYGDGGGGSAERRGSEDGSTGTAGRVPRQDLRGGGTTKTAPHKRIAKRTNPAGLVELGRRSSEKNYFVGRRPGSIVF